MNVRPEPPSAGPLLSTDEGTLVSVSIHVNPRELELLLEALARVEFPINPQIYHDAAMVYLYSDGRRESEPVTLVEFPASYGRLSEVRQALEASGFDPANIHTTGMLEEIHSSGAPEPAPPGAPYECRVRQKFRSAGSVG
jgi:hypothetical protein